MYTFIPSCFLLLTEKQPNLPCSYITYLLTILFTVNPPNLGQFTKDRKLFRNLKIFPPTFEFLIF